MSRKTISIIIPYLNSEKMLEIALLSLKNQTIYKKLEIIAIDGGSTDNTLNILKKYEESDGIKIIPRKRKRSSRTNI